MALFDSASASLDSLHVLEQFEEQGFPTHRTGGEVDMLAQDKRFIHGYALVRL